jgi:surface antigen
MTQSFISCGWVRASVAVAVSAALCAGAGCETKAQSGALIGGLSGAAIGGAIGSTSDARAGEGAAIGAVAGVLGGALIGHAMDKEDEKRAKEAERDDYNRRTASYGSPYDASRSPAPAAITNRDIIDWTRRGVKDEIIIDRVERSGQVFRITAADENDLRDQGVSEPVIRAMKDTARR